MNRSQRQQPSKRSRLAPYAALAFGLIASLAFLAFLPNANAQTPAGLIAN